MTHLSQLFPHRIVSLLVPSASVQLAKQLAQQHPLTNQAEQTYHNLLAVFSVNHYLKLLGIATDLSQCDCLNPFLRLITNVADLEIVGVGRFECCSVSSDVIEQLSLTCMVPVEVQEDRVGYIIVYLDAQLYRSISTSDDVEAQLLGFTNRTNDEQLSLMQLRSLFELPQYLHQLTPPFATVTHLSNWLNHIVEESWLSLDSLVGYQQPKFKYAVRNLAEETKKKSCIYGKNLILRPNSPSEVLTLITEVIDNSDNQLAIELKICPTSGETQATTFLPPGLEMAIFDEFGDAVMHVQATVRNRMMELGFYAEVGDRFQLQVRLEDSVLIESFIV